MEQHDLLAAGRKMKAELSVYLYCTIHTYPPTSPVHDPHRRPFREPPPMRPPSCRPVMLSRDEPTPPATFSKLSSNSRSTVASSATLSSAVAPPLPAPPAWEPFRVDATRCSCSSRLDSTPRMCISISPRFLWNFLSCSSISSPVLEKKLMRSALASPFSGPPPSC